MANDDEGMIISFFKLVFKLIWWIIKMIFRMFGFIFQKIIDSK